MNPQEIAELQRKVGGQITPMGMVNGSPVFSMSTGMNPSDVHVNRPLTNMAIGYKNEEAFADEVCPPVNVAKRSDSIWAWDASTKFDVAATTVASPRGQLQEVNAKLSTTSYSVKDYGLITYVPFDVVQNADEGLMPGAMESKKLSQMLSIAREARISALMVAGNFTGSTSALSGTARWDDTVNSNPVDAVLAKLDTAALLARPNLAVLGTDVYRALVSHPKIKEYILSRDGTTSGKTPMKVVEQLLADIWGVDRVIVPRMKYNSAIQSAAASYSYVWARDQAAFLCVAKTPDPMETQTFAFTFRYSQPVVESWFERSIGAKGAYIYRMVHSDDDKIISGANAGYLFTTVVT